MSPEKDVLLRDVEAGWDQSQWPRKAVVFNRK